MAVTPNSVRSTRTEALAVNDRSSAVTWPIDRLTGRETSHGERPADGLSVCADMSVPEGHDRVPGRVPEPGRQHALVALLVARSEARRVDLGLDGRVGRRLGDVHRAGPDRERAADGAEPEHVPGAECHPRPAGVDLVAAEPGGLQDRKSVV